ncbi:MAG: hypothetical protein Q8J65_02930 [Nitrosomonadales bacterium]|nr:hypothetical protein [Nitrosomonadales bacterium]
MQTDDDKLCHDPVPDNAGLVITLEMTEAFHPARLLPGEINLLHLVQNELLLNLATDEDTNNGSRPLRPRLHHSASR